MRGKEVLLDRDAATHYGVPLKTLRPSVNRNRERVPADSVFRLGREEASSLGCEGKILPLAFTELGVVALAFVLRSPEASRASIEIVRTLARHGALPAFTRVPNEA